MRPNASASRLSRGGWWSMQDSQADDRNILRDATARFLEKHDSLSRIRESGDAAPAFDADAWHLGAELGWAALLVPEEHGGADITGEGLLDLAAIAEQHGR